MDAVYLSASVAENASLCIAPLSKRRMLAAGEEPGSASGYYLFQYRDGDPDNIEILARCDSEDAALKLGQLLKLV